LDSDLQTPFFIVLGAILFVVLVIIFVAYGWPGVIIFSFAWDFICDVIRNYKDPE